MGAHLQPMLSQAQEQAQRYERVWQFKAKADYNAVKLLTMIRGYWCQFDTLNNEYRSICKVTKEPLLFLPECGTVELWVPRGFHGARQSYQRVWRSRIAHPLPQYDQEGIGLKEYITDMSKVTPANLKEAQGALRKKFLATLMLNGANAAKYNKLKCSCDYCLSCLQNYY